MSFRAKKASQYGAMQSNRNASAGLTDRSSEKHEMSYGPSLGCRTLTRVICGGEGAGDGDGVGGGVVGQGVGSGVGAIVGCTAE